MMTTSTRFWAAAIVSTIALAAFSTSATHAGTMRSDAFDFKHRQLAQTTPEARSVGQITVGYGEGGTVRGSGVLIGGRYVLTAAHLVDDALVGQFDINGQSYGMRRWVVASKFYLDDDDDDRLPNERRYNNGADLALVELSRPVVGASSLKAKINKSRREAGQVATIVGFGTGGNGTTGIRTPIFSDQVSLDEGSGAPWAFQPVKRAGQNIVEPQTPFGGSFKSQRELRVDFDPDPSQLASLVGLTPPQLDRFSGEWTLDEDDIPIADEFMPSIGDSGGGLFINGRLAGITSWTTRQNSEFFSTASFTRLSVGWVNWIRSNKRAFNHARVNGTAARPWNTVANGGNGFRGVLKMRAGSQLLDGAGGVIYFEDQIFNIFGPNLLVDETGADVALENGVLANLFISGDLAANPGPLSDRTGLTYSIPEPTSMALLSLGTLALVRRRTRR